MGKSLIVKGEGSGEPAFASYGAAVFARAKTEKSLRAKGKGKVQGSPFRVNRFRDLESIYLILLSQRYRHAHNYLHKDRGKRL